MLASGTFREDLFYRLNVVTINIPPLRERKEDIQVLIDYYLKLYGEENNKKIKNVSKEVFDYLIKYDYPGNIRELKNILERAVILSRKDFITCDALSENIKKKEIKTKISAGTLFRNRWLLWKFH